MGGYQVVGATVIVEVDTPEGRQLRHFYPPAILPDGVPAPMLEHLLSVGLIAPIGDEPEPGDPDGAPADPGDPTGAAAGEGAPADPGDPTGAVDEQPARSASKADWVAYATGHGLTLEEAEALTRDGLVDRFTTPAP